MMVEPLSCFIQLFFKKETLTLDQNISYESFQRIAWARNTKKVMQPRKGNCKRKIITEGYAKNALSPAQVKNHSFAFWKK